MLQRGEAPARADLFVGRVPAVVAVVQWEGRVRVLNLWLWLCPFHRCLIIASARAQRLMQTRKGRVEDRKEGNGSIHTVSCALGRLKSFGFVYICNNFIPSETERNSKAQYAHPENSRIIMDTPPWSGLVHN